VPCEAEGRRQKIKDKRQKTKDKRQKAKLEKWLMPEV
jgi:hypothetical protein